MSENSILLPNCDKLVVSSSPHIHDNSSTSRIMIDVIIAMLPASLAGIYFFGLPALSVLVQCMIYSVAIEFVTLKLLNKSLDALRDGSAIVTGMLLAMNLDANTPWWICLIGSLLAIGLAKQLFGGLGYNVFNPALVGRVALLISFPTFLTTWSPVDPLWGATPLIDAATFATPLATTSIAAESYSLIDLIIGNVPGCLGETSAIALLLGGIYLLIRKLIKWQVPIFFIGTVWACTTIFNMFYPESSATGVYHIFAGGLFLGAFFMATDMVTSPITGRGAIIFAIGCGVITSVIRLWGVYPEGVSFSILFMNAFVPLIDRVTANNPFGINSKKSEVQA
jgi:electron transport complex protein RnfD